MHSNWASGNRCISESKKAQNRWQRAWCPYDAIFGWTNNSGVFTCSNRSAPSRIAIAKFKRYCPDPTETKITCFAFGSLRQWDIQRHEYAVRLSSVIRWIIHMSTVYTVHCTRWILFLRHLVARWAHTYTQNDALFSACTTCHIYFRTLFRARFRGTIPFAVGISSVPFSQPHDPMEFQICGRCIVSGCGHRYTSNEHELFIYQIANMHHYTKTIAFEWLRMNGKECVGVKC